MRAARPIAHAVISALVAGAACGPIAQPPPAPYAVNDCVAHPCSGYARPDGETVSYGCVGGAGACLTSDAFELAILISVPETRVNPGFTFATTYSNFFRGAVGGSRSTCGDPAGLACKQCSTLKCVSLPKPTLQQGSYQVTPELLRQVHATLGDPVATTAAVPATATFRPLWSDTGSVDTASDAFRQGIPLLPVFASKDTSPARTFTWADGVRVAGWRAGLMPGIYERTLKPDPPFDTVLPPEITTLQVAQDVDYDRVIRGVDYPDDDVGAQVRTTVVSRNGADPSLEGWSVYLQDAATEARLSQRAVLHGTGGQVTLHTLGLKPLGTATRSAELVVAPPPDAIGVPTFVDNVLADVVPRPSRYPEVPPAVVVSGRVATAAGVGARAQLLFRDARDDAGSGRLLTAPGDVKSAPFIHYEHRQTTDDQGAYTVTLPPGDYDVFVIPSEVPPDGAPPLAAAKVSLKVAGPPQPAVQQGKNLTVTSRVTARGSCVLTDGRPLPAVEVVATPSSDPSGLASRFLRSGSAITDAAGTYAISLDPGVYDITVRPPVSSGYAWKVSTSHSVTAVSPPLDPIRVPPPSLVEARLLDGSALELSKAIVRAFAVPTRAGSSGTVAVPIGEWATDTEGVLQMWLARPE